MYTPLALAALALATAAAAQQESFGKWCGKYYQIGAPMPSSRPEGSLFPYPQVSDTPLLDFQCVTASSIYIQNDEMYDPPKILVDTNITYDVGQAYHGEWSGMVRIDVWSDHENYLTGGEVPVNSLGNLLDFNMTSLKPQSTPYNITCKAQINRQTFYTTSTLRYLVPNPYGGNTVKVDRTSGALIVRNETAGQKEWQKIIPFGYYDAYNQTSDPAVYGPTFGQSAENDTLNRLHLVKDLGFNMVHPVPPGGWDPYTFDQAATDQFNEWFDTAEQLGLYVQYDMRNSFLNLSSVQYQVELLRNRSNMLAWYTGDEPDGADYALNSTQLAYDLLYQIDGYHPVSLVLNCENYYFVDYGLNGADLVMVDPYPIALNGRWSKPYDTPVDVNFGDSGCDNCNGTFYDISTRIESTRDRARLQGDWRTKPAWIVPQSFNDGGQEFWWRVPTGQEGEAVTTILAFNHGAMGHASWNSQYSSMDLLNNASAIVHLLNNVTDFIIDHYDSRETIYANMSYPGINGYDLAKWTIPANSSESNSKDQVLVFAVNQNYGPNDAGPSWAPVFGLANYTGTVSQVLYGNVTKDQNGCPLFTMGRTSVAAVILEM